ncbi:MAG: hypothetical protein QOH26_1350 [Actinomycetota bacterium]|jgi:hypothetical protein|nr:hypothetical protein [Actinomycetota bacterium]
MVESLIIVGILAAVSLLTAAFGVDTRDGDDWISHKSR